MILDQLQAVMKIIDYYEGTGTDFVHYNVRKIVVCKDRYHTLLQR
jgi:hypothetical protein